MKVQKVKIGIGRSINKKNNEMENINVEMEAQLENEDPHDVFQTLKLVLSKQIDAWESEWRPVESAIEKKPPPTIEGDSAPLESVALEAPAVEQLVCPICKETMKPVEGKGYYLCSKHYGYPDKIKKGEVRDRKY